MTNYDPDSPKQVAREAGALHFFYRQLCVTPPAASPSKINLRGQTAIVTGSNTGLGLEASRQLLGLGLSHLILAVRDVKKGNVARDDLLRTCPRDNKATVEVWPLDMASYDSIVAFANRCQSLPRLDFAILNAGLMKMEFTTNKDTHHEETVQVNYLSTALLAILLLPILKAKAPAATAQLVLVNSDTAAWAKFAEQDSSSLLAGLDVPSTFDFQDRYATSKLLGQLFLRELVKRVPVDVVHVNCVNPGLCYGSTLQRDMGGVMKFVLDRGKRLLGRSLSVGARTLVDAAVVKDEARHGRFLGDCVIRSFPELLYTPKGDQLAKKLWAETMEELAFANVQEIVDGLNK